MLKQHIGKTIGLFVSQLVLLPEIMAMNGTIDLTQLHGTELQNYMLSLVFTCFRRLSAFILVIDMIEKLV